MGGLVVLQAAQWIAPQCAIVLEPSPPGEVAGFGAEVDVVEGTFDPEVVYGPFPPGVRARPESTPARMERKRGISISRLPCTSLVIYGDEFREERGREVARLYGSEERYFPGLDHWELILDRRVPEVISSYLDTMSR